MNTFLNVLFWVLLLVFDIITIISGLYAQSVGTYTLIALIANVVWYFIFYR